MSYLILSLIIFCVGLFGVLIRRNLLIVLMSIELMLSAVNIAFVAFSKMSDSLDGEAIVILNFVLAACEAAVGLAIIVSLYRSKGTIDIGKWSELRN